MRHGATALAAISILLVHCVPSQRGAPTVPALPPSRTAVVGLSIRDLLFWTPRPPTRVPLRTASPRRSLVGTYRVVYVEGPSGSLKNPVRAGELLVADENAGLLALAGDSNHQHIDVYWADTVRTNAAGDVVLSAGGGSSEGYQTRDGMFVVAPSRPSEWGPTWPDTMWAAADTIPPTSPNGVYQLQGLAEWEGIDGIGHIAQWNGAAAVAIAQDSISVHLRISNGAGESMSLFGSSPLGAGGTFAIHDTFYSDPRLQRRLAGNISGGQLEASWTERGKLRRFLGVIHGTRR